MENTSTVTLLEVLPSGDVTHIEVELVYKKGGIDRFSGVNYRRGVYLSVQPVSVRGGLRHNAGFGGELVLIKELKRFSSKCLEDTEVDFTLMSRMIEFVVAKNGLVRTEKEENEFCC